MSDKPATSVGRVFAIKRYMGGMRYYYVYALV